MNSLIPKIDLPRYFNIRCQPGPGGNARVTISAELKNKPKYEASQDYTKSQLVLDDLVRLFPVDQAKIPAIARMFLTTIALPPDFEVAALRVAGEPNKIKLRFDLYGDKPQQWSKLFDTAHLNLGDLAILVNWAKAAHTYSKK